MTDTLDQIGPSHYQIPIMGIPRTIIFTVDLKEQLLDVLLRQMTSKIMDGVAMGMTDPDEIGRQVVSRLDGLDLFRMFTDLFIDLAKIAFESMRPPLDVDSRNVLNLIHVTEYLGLQRVIFHELMLISKDAKVLLKRLRKIIRQNQNIYN